MTDIIPSRSMIQSEAVAARAAVSESILTIVGAESNFTNTYQNNSKTFWLNGPYKGSNVLGIDGIFVFPFNAEIVSITMSNLKVGTVGVSTMDIMKIATPGAAAVSIFAIRPEINTNSSDNTWMVRDLIDGNNINPIGTILPLLNTTIFNKGEGMRCDLFTSMTGAQTLGITIYFRVLNP